MEEKVSNLFDEFSDEPVEASNVQEKVNAIENIADDAVESELETTKLPKAFEDSVDQNKINSNVNIVSTKSNNNKLWTMAVVASVLILIISAAGLIFILLRG